MKVGIIGAGHAGVAAAQVVAKSGNKVTLFSGENSLPYFRPRIPAIAFGQLDKEDAVMHPAEWYKNQNIDLVVNAPVQQITSDKKVVTQNGNEYSFDKIITTSGALPIIPPFAKGCKSGSVIPLWSMENALSIRSKLGKIKHVAIIGGGVIGIEAALRAVDAGLEVSIIERNNYLMERNLTHKASNLIAQLLEKKGIKLYLGQSVESIDDCTPNVCIATDKEEITADLVVLSIGNTFNLQFAEDSGLKKDRAILVNSHMQASNDGFFAAGDVAQLPDIINVCSAIKASKQGNVAATNSVTNDEMAEYKSELISVLLKYKDFELYAIGETATDGLCIEILEESDKVYRALIRKDDKIVGIQMIGDLADHKKYEKEIKNLECCA